jgi:N-methylhydantoinase A
MAGAIRAITVERGRDPVDFSLLPFGGAGPMHACDLAEELGIRDIVVPVYPGNLSALGLLASDLRQEQVRTWLRPLAQVDSADLAELIAAHEASGRALPLLAGVPVERIRFEHTLEMRYARQAFEIPVALPVRMTDPSSILALFLDTYRQLYGHADATSAVEIVSLRSVAVGVTDKPEPRPLARSLGGSGPMEMRAVHLRGEVSPWPVYRRAGFGAGDRFTGPAIVEEDNATAIVLPDWNGIVDGWCNLRLARS